MTDIDSLRNALINDLEEQGFTVWGPQTRTTYLWFTDGTRIGYAQLSGVRGVEYVTVHKPNRQTGAGFQADTPQQALMVIPPGFSGVPTPQKYASFEAFRKQHWQELVEY